MYLEKKLSRLAFCGSNLLHSMVCTIATPPGFRYPATFLKCSAQNADPTCSKKPVDTTESYCPGIFR